MIPVLNNFCSIAQHNNWERPELRIQAGYLSAAGIVAATISGLMHPIAGAFFGAGIPLVHHMIQSSTRDVEFDTPQARAWSDRLLTASVLCISSKLLRATSVFGGLGWGVAICLTAEIGQRLLRDQVQQSHEANSRRHSMFSRVYGTLFTPMADESAMAHSAHAAASTASAD